MSDPTNSTKKSKQASVPAKVQRLHIIVTPSVFRQALYGNPAVLALFQDAKRPASDRQAVSHVYDVKFHALESLKDTGTVNDPFQGNDPYGQTPVPLLTFYCMGIEQEGSEGFAMYSQAIINLLPSSVKDPVVKAGVMKAAEPPPSGQAPAPKTPEQAYWDIVVKDIRDDARHLLGYFQLAWDLHTKNPADAIWLWADQRIWGSDTQWPERSKALKKISAATTKDLWDAFGMNDLVFAPKITRRSAKRPVPAPTDSIPNPTVDYLIDLGGVLKIMNRAVKRAFCTQQMCIRYLLETGVPRLFTQEHKAVHEMVLYYDLSVPKNAIKICTLAGSEPTEERPHAWLYCEEFRRYYPDGALIDPWNPQPGLDKSQPYALYTFLDLFQLDGGYHRYHDGEEFQFVVGKESKVLSVSVEDATQFEPQPEDFSDDTPTREWAVIPVELTPSQLGIPANATDIRIIDRSQIFYSSEQCEAMFGIPAEAIIECYWLFGREKSGATWLYDYGSIFKDIEKIENEYFDRREQLEKKEKSPPEWE